MSALILEKQIVSFHTQDLNLGQFLYLGVLLRSESYEMSDAHALPPGCLVSTIGCLVRGRVDSGHASCCLLNEGHIIQL